MGFRRRGNYAFNTIEKIVQDFSRPMYRGDTWYVGLTANPVASLTAHGFDIYTNSFECWDIPAKDGIACKEAILALKDPHFVTDPESDYIDYTYPNLYIYIYLYTPYSVHHIDTSAFTPMEHMPDHPIVVKYIDRQDAETVVRFGDDFSKQDLEQFLEDLKKKVTAQELNGLVVRSREFSFIEFQFGAECCIISYDSATSQAGCFQSYRSGERSRKPITLFTGEYPACMICSDWEVVTTILRYFMTKNRKPGKRQNIKWILTNKEKEVRKYCKNILNL